MSTMTFILSVSVLLQLIAVVLAIRLVRISGRFAAGMILALAFFAQLVRRSYTLYSYLSGDLAYPPDLVSESIGLLISLLVVIGISMIAPLIRSMRNVVAERQRADEELQENTDKLRITIDEAPICIAMVGLDQSFLKCNKAFCDFLNYSEEELMRKTIAEITFPEDMEVGRADMRAIVAGEKKKSEVQKRYVRKDGAVVWGEVSINLIRNSQGQPMYFLPVILDITERKMAEEALQAEKMNLDAIFESSPVAMMVLDETTNIVSANAAMAVLAGCSMSDIAHHRPGNALRCIHSTKDPRGCGYSAGCHICPARNVIEALLASGGNMQGAELALELVRNGAPQKVWLKLGAEPILMNGRRHLCVAMEDITERKRMEDKQALVSQRTQVLLELNQMAEATLKELTDFVLEEAVRLTQSKIG